MKFNIAGFSNKKSKIDLDYDVNTTAEIGYIQPTLCEEVIPQASYDFECRSMVQVAPLLSPLFGRLSLRQFTSFVPMDDIFHHYAEVIGKRKITHGSMTVVVSSVPTIKYRSLISLLLRRNCVISSYLLYYSGTGQRGPTPDPTGIVNIVNDYLNITGLDDGYITCMPQSLNSQPDEYVDEVFKAMILSNCSYTLNASTTPQYGTFDPTSSQVHNIKSNVNDFYVNTYGSMPTIDDADFVFYDNQGLEASNHIRAYCVRLSKPARELRKAYIGLGLNIDLDCFKEGHPLYDKDISILPFLAYYKAWFDLMYPKRSINFANTSAGHIISYLDSNSFSGAIDNHSTLLPLFQSFLEEISNMTYVFGNDYYTAHLNSLGSTTENGTFGTDDGMYNQVSSSTSLPSYLESNAYSGTKSQITSSALKLLASVNNAVLSGTFIGKRVNDYLRQYGVFSDEDESNFIGSNILDIQTGDVLSTTENDNIFLGQKAGQAQGSSERYGNKADTFNFVAKKHGFIVRFIVIVPKSGFSQGIDPKFFRKTRYDFYNQQFDGIGYELTPSYHYFASNNVTLNDKTSPSDDFPAIGYIGRYSSYKYKTNVANGDFTRRPTKQSIGSYYLDKRFPENEITMIRANTEYGIDTHLFIESPANVPYPSEAIRFCDNEYFDFNRVFVSRDEIDNTRYIRRYFDPVDDHFIIDQINDFKAFAPVLPMSDAQGSTDSINESKNEVTSVELS